MCHVQNTAILAENVDYICIYQKKAVPLSPFLRRYERVFRKRRSDIENAQDRF